MQGGKILTVLPQSEHQFNQELVAWVSRRRGAWTGTASELLASVGKNRCEANNASWPQSSRELYDHLGAHRQMLESLGVCVLLLPGIPRMVSLRSRLNEEPLSKISSDASDIASLPDPPSNLSSPAGNQKESAAIPGDNGHAVLKAFDDKLSTDDSDPARRNVNRQPAAKREFGGCVFENTGEALVAIGEMRQRIREENLGVESAVDVVINRAKEITRSCGIAVGLLPQQKSDQTVGSSSFEGLRFDMSSFQSNLRAGEVVALRDAQAHPLLGTECQRAGIASLIILPIIRDRQVAGAMQFLFREKLDFSPGDVMDLGLVAGVISESFGGSPQIGVTHSERRGSLSDKESVDGIRRPLGVSPKKQSAPDKNLTRLGRDANYPKPASTPESAVLDSLASSRLSAVPTLLWRALKKAWTGRSRHV